MRHEISRHRLKSGRGFFTFATTINWFFVPLNWSTMRTFEISWIMQWDGAYGFGYVWRELQHDHVRATEIEVRLLLYWTLLLLMMPLTLSGFLVIATSTWADRDISWRCTRLDIQWLGSLESTRSTHSSLRWARASAAARGSTRGTTRGHGIRDWTLLRSQFRAAWTKYDSGSDIARKYTERWSIPETLWN